MSNTVHELKSTTFATKFNYKPQNKVTFITFGNEKFKKSLHRIQEEAKSFKIFDSIIGYTDEDLKNDKEFWNKHSEFITKNPRGYGYWLWKSYLTLKTINTLEENELLVYVDAGCTLNINGLSRFKKCIDITENSQTGVLSVYMPMRHEFQYCKMDLIDYLNVPTDLWHSGQYMGGFYILKKLPHVVKLVEDWYNTCSLYHLLDDSPSMIPSPFIYAHYHDQSIWSLLRKLHGTELVDIEGMNEPFDNETPIWITRLN